MASVRYRGVRKRFGEVVAVDNLNFEVEDKEFLCRPTTEPLVARVSPRAIMAVEDRIDMLVDAGRMHLLDLDTEVYLPQGKQNPLTEIFV